jgi:hypothetical protein
VITVQDTSGGGTCDFDTGFVFLTIGDIRINVGLEPVIAALAGYPTPTVADVGGGLATLISNLPGYAAVHAGLGVVNVTGPTGPGGGFIPFGVEHLGTVTNFVLAPALGFLAIGGPAIGPAILT